MSLFIFLISVSATLTNPATFQDFTSSNNKFAASLYQEIVKHNGDNFMVSPLSAQLVLSLSQFGAKHETAAEMQRVLKVPNSKEVIGEVLTLLNNHHDYQLHTANKIYVKEKYPIREEFSTVAKAFGTTLDNLDFAKNEEAARVMNRWVEEETESRIQNLIDPEILSNKTRMVLLNALRFKGNWSVPFQFLATTKDDFYSFGTTVSVDTMHIYEEEFQYYQKLNATFLELPIAGGNVSLTIVLPDQPDGLTTLERQIDQVLEPPQLKHTDLFNIALPKFKMESRIDLKPILQNLGMKRAFEDGLADFSGISGERGDLFVSDVVQKTFLDVNEDGIEAAAATFVVKIVNRNGSNEREFKVNRPFLFFVKVEGLVAFVGRVVVPYY